MFSVYDSIVGLGWARKSSEAKIAEYCHTIGKSRNPDMPEEVAASVAKYCVKFNMRPDIVYAIIMLETNWWKFVSPSGKPGAVKEYMNNPAGIMCGCKAKPHLCAAGNNGLMYHQYTTIEEGVAHTVAHLYCYTHLKDAKGAKEYDPCWTPWYYNVLSDLDIPGDSLLATYTLWSLGRFDKGYNVACANTIRDIAYSIAALKEDGIELDEEVSKKTTPWWIWVGGAVVAGYLTARWHTSWQQRKAKQGG